MTPFTSEEQAVLDHAQSIISERLRREENAIFESPEAVRSYLRIKLAPQEREVFAVLFLDTRHRLIAYRELFFGTINAASVHPREVVKAALSLNAAAVIISHNHPSGNAEPSRADKNMTDRLVSALGTLDISVLDHMVVGSDEIVSFAERGLI